MPLFKTMTDQPSTRVYIWKIDETYKELCKGIKIESYCEERLKAMKSEVHRRGFLSIRHLLKAAGYNDADVYYDEIGKPHLKDTNYISITHSFHFSAIIISPSPVGIDVEKQRDKILRIAHKFTPLEEYKTLANDEAVIRKLTIVWGAKESIYKVMGIPGLLFLQHIYVEDFDFEDRKTEAMVNYDGKRFKFKLKFIEMEGFSCVYALSSKPV